MKKTLLFVSLFLFSFSLISKEKFKVVIDAGHGGSNFGAVYGSVLEKDLTLAVALKLRALFNRHKKENIELFFTRVRDESLQIKKRVEFIEEIQPDLFISLHFNSQKVLTTNRGFEIYYPSDFIGENSQKTALRYDRANRSFLYGSIFKELYLKGNFYAAWKLPFNLFSQKYNLTLFDDTTVPGILLEIAYLSSPEDRACIENPHFIADVARYICDAIIKISREGA